jgi:hypothetical protein
MEPAFQSGKEYVQVGGPSERDKEVYNKYQAYYITLAYREGTEMTPIQIQIAAIERVLGKSCFFYLHCQHDVFSWR